MFDLPVVDRYVGRAPNVVIAKNGFLVLAVRTRGGQILGFKDAPSRTLEKGDKVVVFSIPRLRQQIPSAS